MERINEKYVYAIICLVMILYILLYTNIDINLTDDEISYIETFGGGHGGGDDGGGGRGWGGGDSDGGGWGGGGGGWCLIL